ncbi:MAG: DUF309 domain-containing protein [Candidatus Hodarchaeales archaeon]|jgi:predicted metal-dependent hydrolase
MLYSFPKEFLEGIKFFNLEEFYKQHDVFENLWKNLDKKDYRRMIYQGILNIGVSFYHFMMRNSNDKKNHLKGCQKQLNKGLNRLRHFYEISKNDKYRFENEIIDFDWLKVFIYQVQTWQKWFLNTSNYDLHPSYPKIKIKYEKK